MPELSQDEKRLVNIVDELEKDQRAEFSGQVSKALDRLVSDINDELFRGVETEAEKLGIDFDPIAEAGELGEYIWSVAVTIVVDAIGQWERSAG